MHISALPTPATLVDLNILEANIAAYATLAKRHGKKLCPMTKTSKSWEIIRMQAEAGADGFLAGTLTEAEALAELGRPVMLAYPVLGEANLQRVYAIARRAEVILALDSFEAAAAYQAFFAPRGVVAPYLLTVDVGLHRLGVQPGEAARMVRRIAESCPVLVCRGISTHPGQVYACADMREARAVAEAEQALFLQVAADLEKADFPPEILATGSTPTFCEELSSPAFNMLRPGNYVFQDLTQVMMGLVKEEDCALTVLATVIAHPSPDLFIMDCGSKRLALDRGAHGNAAFSGYGRVLGRPEIEVESLSEEVGKLRAKGETQLQIGDRVRILPNHSCPVANLAGELLGMRGETLERVIEVDLRG